MRRTKLEERYELGEVLGRGGMGVVYKARDRLMGREVAVKTIQDVENNVALDLFYKECSVQSRIVHPNIVEVYDVGEFVDTDGATKPFYVMPLLPGVTLAKLIDDGSSRLTVERSVEIIRSACRGLEAAHENSLIHRDLKPGNLFVMSDDSVKLIDFGIAFILGAGTKTLLKGTLHYMAPELLRMKQPTAMSDVYSLAVVCYQTLCRRLPFEGLNEGGLTEAILNQTPPPLSEVNPAIPQAISQVVHKAMAKQPWHRFSRAKEFGEVLGEALQKGSVSLFDPEQVKQRVQRAASAYEEGDYEFASEMVRELEGEGVLDAELSLLRRRIEQAMRHGRIQKILSTATRFRQAGEIPLALRKIQEALDLDAQDTDALGLKADIERERKERQIGEWLQLAREHLANNAFGRAREATENVIKVKPNETAALELRSEIDRIEKEVERLRERKEQLYQTAVQAWNRGEVTHAMTRLEDLIALEQERPDVERGAAYQKLYQEVRSEHGAIEEAHKQALKHLSEDRLEDAEKTCDRYLSKYPANALFQSLKFDIEERRRQRLSEAIAETDRRVEQEPDLQKKISILEEAAKQFPGESHFERALNIVKERQNLVETIVRKARFHEEKLQWTEALTQWRLLKSIDPGRPGLQYEVERVEKERTRQSSSEAKARWVSEIDAQLEAGDAERAVASCRSALDEFPGDPEIKELLKLAEKRLEKVNQAKERLNAARAALEAGSADEGLDLLREARRLDERNMVIKTFFVHALVERAHSLADSDWQQAAALVDEVYRQEPDYPALEGLRKKLEAHKKDQFVEQFLERARGLQAEGKLSEARNVVEKALGLYPGEAALAQLLATLKRAEAETQGQVEAPAPEAADGRDAPTIVVPPKQKTPPPDPTRPATAGRPDTGARPNAARPNAARPSAVRSGAMQSGAMQSGAVRSGAVRPGAVRPARASFDLRGQLARLDLPGGWVATALSVVAAGVLLAVVMTWFTGRNPEPAAAVQPAVRLTAFPPEAAILIDGQPCGVGTCEIALEPGSYQAAARLPGYEMEVRPIEVGDPDQVVPEIQFRLQPRLPALFLSSNRPSGSIYLNEELVGEFADGQFEMPDLPAGEHEIRVRDGVTDARIRIRVEAAQAPQVLQVQAVNVRVAAASSIGSDTRLYSDRDGVPVVLDGNAVTQQASPQGLLLANLSEGWHEATLGSEDAQASLSFENRLVPSLAAVISADLPTGVLFVITGQDDATVFLNDRPYTRRRTSRGRLRIDPMPGELRVRVEKEGFLAPEEKTVTVAKGRVSRVEFEMRPVPQTSELRLVSGVPGTEVWVGGRRSGSIGSDGSLLLSGLPAGAGRVELRRDGYPSREIPIELEAGRATEIQATMDAAARGVLSLVLSPAEAGAKVSLRRSDGSAPQDVRGDRLNLAPGAYVVEAQASGFQPARNEVEIRAGETSVVRLELRRIEAAGGPAARGPIDYMPLWAAQEGWSPRGTQLVRRGGEFVYAPVKPQSGVYRFSAIRQAGDRLYWFVSLGDQRDHWIFELGRRRFDRIRVSGGKRIRESRYEKGADRGEPFDVEIEVQPGLVTTRVSSNGAVLAEDRLEGEGGDLHTGRWGFWLDGGDQLALTAFSFEAR